MERQSASAVSDAAPADATVARAALAAAIGGPREPPRVLQRSKAEVRRVVTGLITEHGGEHGWTWGPGYRHMGGASRPQCICQVMSLRASAITRYLYICFIYLSYSHAIGILRHVYHLADRPQPRTPAPLPLPQHSCVPLTPLNSPWQYSYSALKSNQPNK